MLTVDSSASVHSQTEQGETIFASGSECISGGEIKLSFKSIDCFLSLFIQPHSKNNTSSRENGRWVLPGYTVMVTRGADLIHSGAGSV